MVSNEILPFILFTALIVTLLVIDLVVLQRRAHSIGMKEAGALSAMWIALALCFNVFIYFMYENQWLGAGQTGARGLSGNEAALQELHRLHGVRVVADDQRRAGVDGLPCQPPLPLGGDRRVLRPPVV